MLEMSNKEIPLALSADLALQVIQDPPLEQSPILSQDVHDIVDIVNGSCIQTSSLKYANSFESKLSEDELYSIMTVSDQELLVAIHECSAICNRICSIGVESIL
ncbi:MAG: hypothetical protein JKX76_02405 [Colwellia sp.]|nr:hypothetical protein [Colwellia sp.]